jgi:hypothetical protein
MARTLSDALIIAVIESATRLAGGRGPISGIAPAALAESGGTAVEARAPGDAAPTPAAAADPAAAPPPADPAHGGEHDSRDAAQIAADFKTIYTQIEGLVRVSAEQETPRVGFGAR